MNSESAASGPKAEFKLAMNRPDIQLWLEVDDGRKVKITPGDALIPNLAVARPWRESVNLLTLVSAMELKGNMTDDLVHDLGGRLIDSVDWPHLHKGGPLVVERGAVVHVLEITFLKQLVAVPDGET